MNLGIQAFGELARQIDYTWRCIRKIDWNQDAFHVPASLSAGQSVGQSKSLAAINPK
jgi:hypothetical protein